MKKIEKVKGQVFSRTDACSILEIQKGVVFDGEFHSMTTELSAGFSVSISVVRSSENVNEKENLVKEEITKSVTELIREVCGPWDFGLCKKLRPACVRSKFGKSQLLNAVYCTELTSEGNNDVELVFNILISQ